VSKAAAKQTTPKKKTPAITAPDGPPLPDPKRMDRLRAKGGTLVSMLIAEQKTGQTNPAIDIRPAPGPATRKKRPAARRKADVPKADASELPAAQLASDKAVRDHWDDPNDTGRVESHLRRGKSYVRQVYGYRRADPVLALHRRSPDQVTARHVQAAERLRDDLEISQGINTGGKGGTRDVGPTEAMIDADTRFRDARASVGDNLWDILARVVLDGWSVKQWTAARPKRDGTGRAVMRSGKAVPAMSEEKASGFLIAALARLDDHYNPRVKRTHLRT